MNRVKTFLKNKKEHFGLKQLKKKNWQFMSVFF